MQAGDDHGDLSSAPPLFNESLRVRVGRPCLGTLAGVCMADGQWRDSSRHRGRRVYCCRGASCLTCSMLLGGMLLVSIAGFTLAYFSMQVGALTVSGPLTTGDVVASFLIAASQLAMPLWLGNVLRQADRIGGIAEVLPAARHWFALFACFALAAAYANAHGASRRRLQGLGGSILEVYESSQRDDRIGAVCCGAVAAGAWVAMLRWQPAPAVLALVLALFAVGIGKALVNQSTTVQQLAETLNAASNAANALGPD